MAVKGRRKRGAVAEAGGEHSGGAEEDAIRVHHQSTLLDDGGGGRVDYWAESAVGLGPDVFRVGLSKSKPVFVKHVSAWFLGKNDFSLLLVCGFLTTPTFLGFKI